MKKIGKLSKALLYVMLITGLAVTSCKDDDDDGNNNGKTDPNTVATANLVAHFPFEDTGEDEVSGTMPVQQPGVAYINGQRGKAYQGSEGAFYLYDLPAASKLKTLKAFTVAMWFYGTPALQGVDAVPGILQLNGTSDAVWGNLMLTQDRMAPEVDSLNIKMVFHKEGVTWNNQFVGFSKPEFTENLWLHLAFTYDNATSKYMVYVNGEPLDLDAGITDRWAEPPEASPRPPLGDLVFNNVTQFVIGGWHAKVTGVASDVWMGNFTGQMDELRLYDKGLTSAEVKSLFDAEVTQLD